MQGEWHKLEKIIEGFILNPSKDQNLHREIPIYSLAWEKSWSLRQLSVEAVKHAVVIIFTSLAYLLTFLYSQNWWLYDQFSTWYMPVGVVLGLFLALPLRFTLTILVSISIGYGWLDVWGGKPFSNALWFNFYHHACYYFLPLLAARMVIQRFYSGDYLDSLKGIMVILIYVSINQVGNVLQMGDWIWNNAHKSDYFEIRLTHFIGGATGILLTVPSILAIRFYYLYRNHLAISQLTKPALIAALFCLSAIVIYSYYPQTLYMLRVLAFVPIILFAYFYGWAGAWVITTIVTWLLLTTVFGHQATQELYDTQFYLFVYSLCGLMLGAVMSEQRTLNKRLNENNQQLVHANQLLNTALVDNQQLTRKVVNIQEQERKSVAQELHDEIGQNVISLQVELEVLKKQLPALGNHPTLHVIVEYTKQIYETVYQLLHWLRPRILDEFGLYRSLTMNYFGDRLRRSEILFNTDVPEQVDELTPDHAIAIFRIVQESVTNCIKHSQANNYWLKINLSQSCVNVEIKDDGIGFEGLPNAKKMKPGGFGLSGIKDRVYALNGSLTILSEPGAKLIIKLPLSPHI